MLGLNVSIWLNAGSIIVGVILAGFISPWLAARTSRRDQQERLLRILLNTWQLPANADYQSSIALIPLDFKGCPKILSARQGLLKAVNTPAPEDQDAQAEHNRRLGELQAALISEIAKELDFDITPESLMSGAYLSKGFVDREHLILGALVAWQRIAHALERNNEMFAATLSSPGEGKDSSEIGSA